MILNPVSCFHGEDLFVPTCNTKAMRVAVKAKVGPKTAKIIEQPQTPNSPKHLQARIGTAKWKQKKLWEWNWHWKSLKLHHTLDWTTFQNLWTTLNAISNDLLESRPTRNPPSWKYSYPTHEMPALTPGHRRRWIPARPSRFHEYLSLSLRNLPPTPTDFAWLRCKVLLFDQQQREELHMH